MSKIYAVDPVIEIPYNYEFIIPQEIWEDIDDKQIAFNILADERRIVANFRIDHNKRLKQDFNFYPNDITIANVNNDSVTMVTNGKYFENENDGAFLLKIVVR